MIVENVGGGGGSLGGAAVAHARPDGYTILLGGHRGDPQEPSATTECAVPMTALMPPAPEPFAA
jgi:tripartite-type tricarboxylate transporter receptor subunit TctC